MLAGCAFFTVLLHGRHERCKGLSKVPQSFEVVFLGLSKQGCSQGFKKRTINNPEKPNDAGCQDGSFRSQVAKVEQGWMLSRIRFEQITFPSQT